MYYNGVSHETAVKTTKNGIHKWCERGGIVGRGVLVDWVSSLSSSPLPTKDHSSRRPR